MHVSEIRVKRIRVNQGLGVCIFLGQELVKGETIKSLIFITHFQRNAKLCAKCKFSSWQSHDFLIRISFQMPKVKSFLPLLTM